MCIQCLFLSLSFTDSLFFLFGCCSWNTNGDQQVDKYAKAGKNHSFIHQKKKREGKRQAYSLSLYAQYIIKDLDILFRNFTYFRL